MDPDKLAHWKAADAAFDQWLDLSATGPAGALPVRAAAEGAR